MRFFAVLFAVLAWSSQAGAEVYDDNFRLSQINGVDVVLNDSARGACWTNLKEVREYAEEKLLWKGVKILTEEKPFDFLQNFMLEISVVANRLYEDNSGPCYGVINFSLRTISKINDTLMYAVVGEATHLILRKTNLNRDMIDVLKEFIAKLK